MSYLRLQASVFTLDLPALASVIGMSFILMRSTADSSLFNNLVTGLNVALIIFVLAAGFPHVEAENYHPFAPFGARGIFTGACVRWDGSGRVGGWVGGRGKGGANYAPHFPLAASLPP